MNPAKPSFEHFCPSRLGAFGTLSFALLLAFVAPAHGFYPSFVGPFVAESSPYVYAQPVGASVIVGQSVQFSGGVTAVPTATFQWRRNGVPLRGATSAVLLISNAQPADAGNYDFVATNSHGSATSQTATLTVVATVAPTITSQPGSALIEVGTFTFLSVVATGTPPPTFQWRKDGIEIRGATLSSIAIPNTQPADAGTYDVVITNSAGTITSAAAVITVGTLPTVAVLQPVSMLINWGAVATFDFVATGRTVRYQWKKNGVAIPGATNHSFSVSSATAADMGFYSATASGDGGTVESDAAVLTIDSMSFWSITTLAGTAGLRGSADGHSAEARFDRPNGLAIDRAGNLFVADSNNHALRKIAPDGTVTTFARGLDDPDGVAVDDDGNVFVAEWGRHVVDRITPDGVVQVFAGQPNVAGSTDGSASDARFNHPAGVALDRHGNLFVTENSNYTIRKITPAGVVSTVAGKATVGGYADGTGAAARFSWPNGIAIDGADILYVTDANSSTIRRISPNGEVITLAGFPGQPLSLTGDGTGARAAFISPAGLAVDGTGNVYVTDTHRHTIRRISSTGEVTTIAGNGPGTADGVGGDAHFDQPYGIVLDSAGNLYVTDQVNCTIRKGVRLSGTSTPSRLINLSTRGFVPAGGALTPGFTLRGTGPKQLVIRAAGPALAAFGVTGVLSDPKLSLVPAGSNLPKVTNDDWGIGSQTAALSLASTIVGAFPFASGSKDAAVLATLSSATNSSYSVPITSTSATASGIALAEIYDVDPFSDSARLTAVSTLGFVGTGNNALVPGFIIGGKEPKRLLIRAVGPGLADFGVGGALADPQIAVTPAGRSFNVARNDNWRGDSLLADAFDRAGAFALAPTSKDAALIVRLPPGSYTVTVSGVGDATGNALVEIYDLDP